MKQDKNKYCTHEQNKVLSEVYRRLNYFHHGNVDEPLLMLALPSDIKKIAEFGLLKPYSKEVPRALNWYNLTGKGKEYFKDHIVNIREETNANLFSGRLVKKFIKP